MDTFFRLVAGILQPNSGSVSVNARWKVIYVPLEPIIFSGSIMYNLTLHAEHTYADEEVWDLCRSMGMSPELIGRNDLDVGLFGDLLRNSDRVLVSLIQALVYGVDVLLLSSTVDTLGPNKAILALRTLRRYVRHRGTAGQPLPFLFRHEKTVLYTTKQPFLWQEFAPDYVVTYPGDELSMCTWRATTTLV